MPTWRDTLQRELASSYRIHQELGGGGMSATYIAEEVALGRSVVIKALSPELASGLNVERFQREVQLAARLQHAFIVPLLSAGVTDGHPWYTMPLVQGESLRARIAREGALTAGATARILRDVAEALAYAHERGIVHRDIKPDNILLSGSHALVTDFGIAKALAASTGEVMHTGTGIAIGTPAYMAPEQAAGDPDGDHRIDLYALGATAYEMLSGRPIFGDRSPARLLMAHAAEAPEPLAKVAKSVPADLAALVDQLLSKHPNDRPSRAQDVAEALSAMLSRWTSGELPSAAAQVTLARALGVWLAIALPATVAAWLAVRWLPVPEWTLPATVIAALVGIPAVLLSVWLHRPARPISVQSVASTTTVGKLEAIARPAFTLRRVRFGGIAAVALVMLGAATWAASRALGIGPGATLQAQGVVGAEDRVLVTDFEAPPSDTGLGAVVTDLMRTELGRTSSLRYVPASARALILRSMGREPTERVFGERARELAQRTNAKVYLAGSVTQFGSGYLLRSSIIETATGSELANFRRTAATPDDLIRAVDRMGREVRDKLGESVRSVRSPRPLYYAVTSSLQAARLHTEGQIAASRGDRAAGIRMLERAVEIDTSFAMAYRRLASYYNNGGEAERASWAAARAYRHRDKLGPILQRLVEGTWYASPAGFDAQRTISTYQSVLDEFPREPVALNNIAVMYLRLRDAERASEMYRRAIEADSTSDFAPTNIPGALWANGEREATREYISGNLRRWMNGDVRWQLVATRLQSAELRPDSVERMARDILKNTGISGTSRFRASALLANAQRALGKPSLAMETARRAGAADPGADTVGRIPQSVTGRAEILAWDLERPDAARRLLDSIVAARPPGAAGPLGYAWLRLATGYALAGDAARARAMFDGFDKRATANMKAFAADEYHAALGYIALAEKRSADAIAAFRRADVGLCTACGKAQLAHAFDVAGQGDSAITYYEGYLASNYFYRGSIDGRYLAVAYKRLGELYDARGDVARARTSYERFVDLMKGAERELQPRVEQVRRRLQTLRPPS